MSAKSPQSPHRRPVRIQPSSSLQLLWARVSEPPISAIDPSSRWTFVNRGLADRLHRICRYGIYDYGRCVGPGPFPAGGSSPSLAQDGRAGTGAFHGRATCRHADSIWARHGSLKLTGPTWCPSRFAGGWGLYLQRLRGPGLRGGWFCRACQQVLADQLPDGAMIYSGQLGSTLQNTVHKFLETSLF